MRVTATRRIIKLRTLVFLLLLALLATLAINFYFTAHAATTSTTIRPSSNISTGWTPTPSGSGTNYQRVDEGPAGNDSDYVQAQNAATDEYGMQDIDANAERATDIKLRVRMTRQSSERCTGLLAGTPQNVPLVMGIRVNGVLQTVNKTITGANGTYAWYEQSFSGTYTQADINTLQAYISKANQPSCAGLLGQTIQAVFRVSMVETVITWQSPDANQNAARIYQNQDSLQPGLPIAATNTATDVSQNTQFRLRIGIQNSSYNWLTGSWGTHANQYKLQYAQKSAATCNAQATGWGDVTGITSIRYHNNPTPVDGAAISSNPNDPSTGSSVKIYQSYEESNPINLINPVAVGQTAVWDFALENAGSITPGSKFCFRIYKNDGTPINTYNAYPEVVITKSYGVGIVDAAGSDVVSPFVPFSTSSVTTTQCALSTAMLGTPSQKIRINNDLVTNGWDVSIAATGGSTALWAAGANRYDFNDPSGSPGGCDDGGDTDAYGGQLRVNSSTGSVIAKPGCTLTGLSWGPDAKFSQAVTDAISLGSANATADRFCYWDITNIQLEQRIPARTPAGSYSLDMTLTMTAL